MRKDRAVLQMASVQSSGATGGASGERHVLGGIEALVAGTVELTPQPPCLVVVLPCCVILKVQNQPQFETRVGYGELDAIRAGLLNGLYESWMVPWPLDIEHAPELIDLRFLVDGPAAGLSGHGYECSRNGSALPGLDPEVNSRHVSHRWLPFKGVEILRFGSLSFAEDHERLSRLSRCHLPLERTRASSPVSAAHRASLGSRPRARRSVNWSSSGTAPNLP